jgi:hypothetical protein
MAKGNFPMNDAEKVNVLKSALEQLLTEVNHILGRFRAQVSLENEQSDLDPVIAKHRHKLVYESIKTEWEVIRTLYLLLITNTRDIMSPDPEETLQPIENLLEKLKEGENPFKYHEFQFPFHLSSLVSGIKSVVKNHIMHIAPKELEKCDLFSNTNSSKSPKKDTEQPLFNPIVTKNVKQAAKKFEAITETIAESASKLKRVQTKKPVVKITTVLLLN